MKIYTKTGDRGETSIAGGERLPKDFPVIEAIGKVDELNSLLGMIITDGAAKEISKKLKRIQGELFTLGSDIATPMDSRLNNPRINNSYTKRLEKEIDAWEKNLPKLKNFILPGGSPVASRLHLARAFARCLERIVVRLARENSLNGHILVYLNRLSDWFFVCARHANFMDKREEEIWSGRVKNTKP